MPSLDDANFWVGRHATRGLVVIPRNAFLPNLERLEVYFVDQNRVADCGAEIIRSYTTEKDISPDEASTALRAFITYRNQELEEKNKHFLERRGKSFAGTRIRPKEQLRRVTHCYHCKRPLDSSMNLECVACGWILCQCGACGCVRT